MENFIVPEEDKKIDMTPGNKITNKQRTMLLNAIKTSGVFVSMGKKYHNVMSTHWGTIGTFWNKDVFVLPIRKSKMSHAIVDQTGCFAISVPIKDMRQEIIACDHLSGYNINKFEKLHLHPSRAKKIPCYTVSECGLFLECKVIYSGDMDFSHLDESLQNEMYSCKDFHTMYFAEILDVYGDIEL